MKQVHLSGCIPYAYIPMNYAITIYFFLRCYTLALFNKRAVYIFMYKESDLALVSDIGGFDRQMGGGGGGKTILKKILY